MRSLLVAVALCVALAVTPATARNAVPAASSLTETNRAIVTDFVDLFYKQHKVREAFEKYVAPAYIQHNPIASDGRDAAINALAPYFASQPNMKHEIQRIIVDGDLAAVHVRATNGPNDRGAAVVDMFRLADGKIVEHWDVIQPVPAQSANAHPMF